MSVLTVEIRSGAYYDSVILMQLQRSLMDFPGVLDAGVVMGTKANKDVLEQSNLLAPETEAAEPDDLIIVVRGKDNTSADEAIGKVDELLSARRSAGIDQEYYPKSLETAIKMLPEAQWVLISVPGRYASNLAQYSLDSGKHVFLYSDNVTIENEISLKKLAAEKCLLVMGPDCGTAIINGVGLGFANKVRHGPIGIVAASGTGLQQVSSRIHQFGSGITHALGTGGRDLSEQVNAITARQGLDLLSRDPETKVICLISKPPSPQVANELIDLARKLGKPVVVNFIGFSTSSRKVDNVYFTASFDETAQLALDLAASGLDESGLSIHNLDRFTASQKYLRGLFSGGTLAYEALLILQDYIPNVYSNTPINKEFQLLDSMVSKEHTIIDLGEDEFTVGRLHPMMDNDLRIRRLLKEASDPEVAVILLDVVLGYGAHPNPASELAPAIAEAKSSARDKSRYVEIVAIVSGTDEDPQGIQDQIKVLEDAGAIVELSSETAVRQVGRLINSLILEPISSGSDYIQKIDIDILRQPLTAINIGLESFMESLLAQEAEAIHVDWRPPAGGDERLMSILAKMRKES